MKKSNIISKVLSKNINIVNILIIKSSDLCIFTLEILHILGNASPDSLEKFFEYHENYLSYIKRNLITITELFAMSLKKGEVNGAVFFKELGEYRDILDRILDLGFSFEFLLQLTAKCPFVSLASRHIYR